MSFFYEESTASKRARAKELRRIPVETLQEMGCKACPLDSRERQLEHPKMESTGVDDPAFYFIGEAPGETEDKRGKQFVGDSGQYLRERLPGVMKNKIRWDNTIRCRPPSNRDPTDAEINCCFPLINKDIEKYKPWAVVGFGNVPLRRFSKSGVGGITLWRGKRFPIRVGDHVCWYYPVMHPSGLLRNSTYSKTGKRMENENDKTFSLDLRNIYTDYKKEKGKEEWQPIVISGDDEEQLYDGVEILEDYTKRGFRRLCKWLDYMEEQKRVGLDYECQFLRPYKEGAKCLTVALSNGERTYAFPLDHPKAWPTKLRKKVLRRFREFLLNSGSKVAHNLSMELEWSGYTFGEDTIDTDWDDTMAQAYVLDQRKRQKGKTLLDLDSVVFMKFGFWLKSLYSMNYNNMVAEPLDKVLGYNALDSKYCYLAFGEQLRVLRKRPNRRLLDFTYPHQVRTNKTMAKVSLAGLLPDFDAAEEIDASLTEDFDKVLKKINRLPEIKRFKKQTRSVSFNPLANDDVSYVLGKMLDRPEIQVGNRKHRKGTVSVDEKVLLSIPEKATKLPKLVLEARSLNQRKSNWVEGIYEFTTPDGRIHPIYNTMFTATGRLSSGDGSINLQNFPMHRYRYIRRIIRAPDGYLMVFGDYGAIEFRCVAMSSRDPNIVKSLWDGLDIHQHWADRFIEEDDYFLSRVARDYNLDDEQAVRKEARQEAKNKWVFPLIFGASANSAAGYMQTDLDLVKDLMKEYWDEYPGVKDWQKKLIRDYDQFGYVESLLGRRRYAPISYNEIINTSIQGLASDITTDAMNRCSEETDHLQILNTHDEIGFYIPIDGHEEAIDDIAEIMLFPDFDFINVPLLAEFKTGPNWFEQKEYGEYSSDEYEEV